MIVQIRCVIKQISTCNDYFICNVLYNQLLFFTYINFVFHSIDKFWLLSFMKFYSLLSNYIFCLIHFLAIIQKISTWYQRNIATNLVMIKICNTFMYISNFVYYLDSPLTLLSPNLQTGKDLGHFTLYVGPLKTDKQYNI